MIKKRKTV